MMKRLAASLLAGMMLISLAACGGKTETSEPRASETANGTEGSAAQESGPNESVETGPTDAGQTGMSGTTARGGSTGGSRNGTTTSKGGGTTPGNKKIVWWTTNPGVDTAKFLNTALEAFEKKTGYTVDMYIQPETGGTLTSFDDKFVPAMSSGKGPDVTTFQMVNPEYALDITGRFDQAFWGQFFPFATEKIKYGGKYYSTPSGVSVNGLLLYSKTAFRNAGYDVNKPPTTIKQLDDMSDKLYVKNGDDYSQLGYVPWNWLVQTYPELLVKPFGGAWVNGEGYPTANSAANVKALEWVVSYTKKYGKDRVDASAKKMENENNSYGHSVAMQMSFSAGLNALAKSKENAAEWGLSVFPGEDSSKTGLSIGLSAGYSLVRDCKNTEGAVEFIRFMSTEYQTDYYMKNYQINGAYTSNQNAWKKYYSSLDGFTKMMYDQVLTKAKASDIGSNLTVTKYSTPATYTTLQIQSIKKIIEGQAEAKAELDSLQQRIAAQTKQN